MDYENITHVLVLDTREWGGCFVEKGEMYEIEWYPEDHPTNEAWGEHWFKINEYANGLSEDFGDMLLPLEGTSKEHIFKACIEYGVTL